MIRDLYSDARPVSIKSRVQVLPVPEDFLQQVVDSLDELPDAEHMTSDCTLTLRTNCSLNRLFRSALQPSAPPLKQQQHRQEEEALQHGIGSALEALSDEDEEDVDPVGVRLSLALTHGLPSFHTPEALFLEDLEVLKWKGTTVVDEFHTNTISLYTAKCRLRSTNTRMLIYLKEVSRASGLLQSYKSDSFFHFVDGPYPGKIRSEYCRELIEYVDTGNELENVFEMVEWDGQNLMRNQLEGCTWGAEDTLVGCVHWLNAVFSPYHTPESPDRERTKEEQLNFLLHMFRVLTALSLTVCQHRPDTRGIRWPEAVLRRVLLGVREPAASIQQARRGGGLKSSGSQSRREPKKCVLL